MAISGSADGEKTTESKRRVFRPSPIRNILALILREMSTRYGRTPGGYVWMIVEPMAGIMLLAVGFSLLLRSPSLGISFLLS